MVVAIPETHPAKHTPEAAVFLGSVKPAPYTLHDKRTDLVRELPAAGAWYYFAFADGVYAQYIGNDGTRGNLRAYAAWSQWAATEAARALFGANAIEDTRRLAGEKVPSTFGKGVRA